MTKPLELHRISKPTIRTFVEFVQMTTPVQNRMCLRLATLCSDQESMALLQLAGKLHHEGIDTIQRIYLDRTKRLDLAMVTINNYVEHLCQWSNIPYTNYLSVNCLLWDIIESLHVNADRFYNSVERDDICIYTSPKYVSGDMTLCDVTVRLWSDHADSSQDLINIRYVPSPDINEYILQCQQRVYRNVNSIREDSVVLGDITYYGLHIEVPHGITPREIMSHLTTFSESI